MQIGDRVKVNDGTYYGTGTIVRFETNLFGARLIIVHMDNNNYEPCFYPNEVELV